MDTNAISNAVPSLTEIRKLPEVMPTFAAFNETDRISFIRNYDPAIQTITGMRHVVLRFRSTDKKVEKPAKMLTIPALTLPEAYTLIEANELSLVQGMYEDEQDAMIRSWYDQGVSNILWDNLTFPLVVAAAKAVKLSQRLTKDQVLAWANIALVVACHKRADEISAKANYTPEQQAKQRAGTVKAYVDLASKMAAPVPNLGENEAKALNTMLVNSALADDMANILKKKLHAILNPVAANNGDL